jgi:hypothetical protein
MRGALRAAAHGARVWAGLAAGVGVLVGAPMCSPSPLRANGQDTTAYVRPFVKDGAYAESIRSAKEARSIKRPYMKIVHGRASPDLAAEIGG